MLVPKVKLQCGHILGRGGKGRLTERKVGVIHIQANSHTTARSLSLCHLSTHTGLYSQTHTGNGQTKTGKGRDSAPWTAPACYCRPTRRGNGRKVRWSQGVYAHLTSTLYTVIMAS